MTFITRLPPLGHGDGVVFIGDETMTGGGSQQQFAPRHMHEHGGDVGFRRQVDETADRFAIAAPARQLAAIQREEAAIGASIISRSVVWA